jgi:hypothetical protein
LVAILVGSRDHRVQVWEGAIQGLFHQSFVPIATKLWWNDPWMAPFQTCIRWSGLQTKMATKLKIEKRGDEIKKKSSPLKLLSQSQPNFAEMIQICVRHFIPPKGSFHQSFVAIGPVVSEEKILL